VEGEGGAGVELAAVAGGVGGQGDRSSRRVMRDVQPCC
jgi:hypothetical protein